MSGQKTELAYYLKRGETIQGPLTRSAILQAVKGRKLLSGDQIANGKDGPWLDITKEPLQRMQQGSDIEIKSTERWVTTPPKGRAELKKWLQANKDESSVSCPHCGTSVKHSNLLQHCDKLHYSRLSTTGSSLPVSQTATKNPAGKSKKPKAVLKNTVFSVAAIALGLLVLIAGVWGLGGLVEWAWELATQGWASSGAFRVTTVCIGVALALWICVKLGKEGVLIILGTTWLVICCWGIYAMVAFFQPEGALQWFRTFAGIGFGFGFLLMIAFGVMGVLETALTGKSGPDSEGDGVMMGFLGIPMVISFLSFGIGGIGATLLWLYSG